MRCLVWGDSGGINVGVTNVRIILCGITAYDLTALRTGLQFTNVYVFIFVMSMAWLIFFIFEYSGNGF